VKSRLTPGNPKYDILMNEYVDAYSKYDGWVSVLKSAIVAGKEKNLSSDREYAQIAKDASSASQKFVQDAIDATESATNRGVGVIAVLSSLADIGVKVWNSYASGSQERRMKYADYVANDIKWRGWEDISVSGATKSKHK